MALRNRNPSFPSSFSDSTEEEIWLYTKIINTVALKVKRHETISNLKSLLREKAGISENLQELFFAGNRLLNDRSLVDYGIQQDSTVHLVIQKVFGMRIYVKTTSDQKIIAIEARSSDTIQNIKSIIQAKEGIQSDQYTLIHNGKVLEDERILSSLNIPNEATFHLVFNPKDVLPIFVRTVAGEMLKLEVKVLYTIRDVKTIVGSMSTGVLNNGWDLIYAGKQLEDWRTLASYDIKEETILEMSRASFPIFVKPWSGKTINFIVQRCNTIKDVKDKLSDRLGVPVHLQGILFNGKRLEDDRDLASYGVRMDSTLHMALWHSNRIIKISDIWKTIPSGALVHNLMSKIERKFRSLPKVIYFDGVALQDDRLLADYRINREAMVTVTF